MLDSPMEPENEIAERLRYLTVGGHMESIGMLTENYWIIHMRSDEIESILSKKTYVKQSISDTEPEVTVICVDNSALMTTYLAGDIDFYKPQAEAVILYAQEKINAHPRNEVGLLAMGCIRHNGFVKPTRDLNKIRFALEGLTYFGQSCIPIGEALTFFIDSNLPKRRLLVFSGGRLSMESAKLEFYATRFKEFKVAVDVVSFGWQFVPPSKPKLLKAFVEAADNDGNSHYLYAPSESETSLAEQILCSPLAPGGLPMQEEKEQEVKKIEEEEEKKIEEEEEEEKKIEEEEEEKKKEGEEVKNKKKLYNKLKNYRKKLAARAEEAKKKEEEEVKKKEEEEAKKKEKMEQLRIQEEKKKEEEVKEKEKMEPHLLPVEQLERWILGLPVQEEKKKEEQVKKKEKMQQKLKKKEKR